MLFGGKFLDERIRNDERSDSNQYRRDNENYLYLSYSVSPLHKENNRLYGLKVRTRILQRRCYAPSAGADAFCRYEYNEEKMRILLAKDF